MFFISRCLPNLQETSKTMQTVRYLSNKSAFITKVRRKMYLKLYPTTVVQPDGSTYTIRYHEPRRIIKLPIDLSKLTEEERAYYLEMRKPKKKVIIEEDIEDNYNANEYLKYINK